ncbi:putative nucleic acid-binding protein [Streptacidiphilus sp. MAP12-20]
MNARVPVYDTGMLIALADRKAKAVRLHESLKATPHRAIVPGPVLGQVWRPAPSTVHALATALRDCTVPHARSSPGALRPTAAGQPVCLLCSTALDMTEWHRIGGALGTADLPPKKRPDVVDAMVAMTAIRHGSAVVFTSDPDDIGAYLSALNAQDVHLVAI